MEDKKVTIETVEGETIELNVEKEKWYKRAWNKTTKTVKDIVEVAIDHPVATSIVVGSAVKLIDSVVNGVVRVENAKTKKIESSNGNTTFYDDRNHVNYELRRPLTNSQKIEITIRKNNGEEVYQILEDMNLI